MSFPYNPVLSHGKEAYVTCPFNETHKMSESSLQRHIMRCMVNHPQYVSCPYNAMHFFRSKEILQQHLESCPCKPFELDKIKNIYCQEELIHAANLRNLRYWNMEYENWDKED